MSLSAHQLFGRILQKRITAARGARDHAGEQLHRQVQPHPPGFLIVGGTMRQGIFDDPHDFLEWDLSVSSRCFVHLCNSLMWRQVTGSNPPHPPFTAKEYARAGVPWFDYYRDDLSSLSGSTVLDKVKSVFAFGQAKGEKPLPDNSPVEPELIVQYGNARRPDEVREWVER